MASPKAIKGFESEGLTLSEITNAPKVQNIIEWAFLLLQVIGGQLGLFLLLATFMLMHKRTLRRDPVVNNFCFTWLLSSIFYSLILYMSRTDPNILVLNPSSDQLCLAQAALINGVQAMTAMSSLGLIANLWLSVHQPNIFCDKPTKTIIKAILVIMSYIAFFAFFLSAFVIGSQPAIVTFPPVPGVPPPPAIVIAPNLAVPTPLYCIIVESGPITNSASGVFRVLISAYIFSAIMYGITLLIEGHLLWSILCKRNSKLLGQSPYRETFIRVMVFSGYRVISLIMLSCVIRTPSQIFLEGVSTKLTIFDAIAELVQAGVPLVAFLVLGTRKDILVTWKIRKSSIAPLALDPGSIPYSEKDQTIFVVSSPTSPAMEEVARSEAQTTSPKPLRPSRHQTLDLAVDEQLNLIEVGSAHTASEFRFPQEGRKLSLDKDLPAPPPSALLDGRPKGFVFFKRRF